MSDLTFIERSKLERQFELGGGYVLDFSNQTFEDFILESTGRYIYDSRYNYRSGSKANRLRAFWKLEPNHVVGRLTRDMLDYCQSQNVDSNDTPLLEQCWRIAERLLQGAPVDQIDAIALSEQGRDFDVLSRAIRDAIDKNEPDAGLDRLHTFVIRYVRTICEKRGISTGRDKPLHSLFGEYVKNLKADKLIESEMTERILRSSISVMEAFNQVRNEQSLAHDNPVLNYNESLLIYNHVCGAIQFIRELEDRADKSESGSDDFQIGEFDDGLPF